MSIVIAAPTTAADLFRDHAKSLIAFCNDKLLPKWQRVAITRYRLMAKGWLELIGEPRGAKTLDELKIYRDLQQRNVALANSYNPVTGKSCYPELLDAINLCNTLKQQYEELLTEIKEAASNLAHILTGGRVSTYSTMSETFDFERDYVIKVHLSDL